ncbi:response regulator [Chitinophaga sancti]|uniref:Response regulator receiver domain-containing protein n=1 Tax=Chitinophaga sancti TaxID=1004 RepID=A0A1K1R694_9BACT|nr:response regulator transcription factor [Chitinophaga sancti]WQD64215.1 response regulator transcription factor [Chitinophaga sancti]WQG90161.1 response regulator transcription factor [Chitinophaga sancti]SFW67420.1 Response regulator receiver domain-containing protein [Chitinophaga sancti]
MDNEHIFYPEFDHPASQLSAFSLCIDTFIISLKNGEIVKFQPAQIAHFKQWLNRFNVRNIAVDSGIPQSYSQPDTSKPFDNFLILKNEIKTMSEERKIKTAFVDDHDLLRKGICDFLREDSAFEVIFEAENGKSALEKMEQSEEVPDVMIVDINMPVMNGFETAKALLEKYPQTNILAFSVNDEVQDVVKMLNCGAKGYILKGADPEELKKAIKIISGGGQYFSAGVYEIAKKYYKQFPQ